MDEDEKKDELQNKQINQSLSLDQENSALENYSISNDADKSHFFLHFRALLRKRFLMQRRDTKTLAIDTIFPILLIIVGLALSTISFFKDGVPREMSPFIFPTDKLDLVYNTNSGLINKDLNNLAEIDPFYQKGWVGMNSSSIDQFKGVDINLNIDPALKADIHLFDAIKQLDSAQFNLVHQDKDPHAPFFGQFYVNSLNDPAAI